MFQALGYFGFRFPEIRPAAGLTTRLCGHFSSNCRTARVRARSNSTNAFRSTAIRPRAASWQRINCSSGSGPVFMLYVFASRRSTDENGPPNLPAASRGLNIHQLFVRPPAILFRRGKSP